MPIQQYVAIVDGSGTVIPIPGTVQGTLTDRSGTVTLGGTAQTLAAANTSRKYLIVQNQDLSEDLWFNFTTAAVTDQPSFRLTPKQSFVMEGDFISTELISVIAATTGHKFSAKEG